MTRNGQIDISRIKVIIMHQRLEYAGCGELMTKALKYALAEWPDMKHVLENGDVELSIESCKLNSLSPEKYIRLLLDKFKGSDDQMDKTTLLLCYCSL